MADDARTLDINGRTYQWPRQPVVVVCMDGSEPGYVEAAVETGKAPFFARMLAEGTNRLADCVIPRFTNPNNMSIVTGVAPATHGIAANFSRLLPCQPPSMTPHSAQLLFPRRNKLPQINTQI